MNALMAAMKSMVQVVCDECGESRADERRNGSDGGDRPYP